MNEDSKKPNPTFNPHAAALTNAFSKAGNKPSPSFGKIGITPSYSALHKRNFCDCFPDEQNTDTDVNKSKHTASERKILYTQSSWIFHSFIYYVIS